MGTKTFIKVGANYRRTLDVSVINQRVVITNTVVAEKWKSSGVGVGASTHTITFEASRKTQPEDFCPPGFEEFNV